MKPYLISLAAGIIAGVVYGLMGVRSPAPPVIALAGLFGILIGEQAVPFAGRLWQRMPVTAAWIKNEVHPHIFGTLPTGLSGRRASAEAGDNTMAKAGSDHDVL